MVANLGKLGNNAIRKSMVSKILSVAYIYHLYAA